MRRRALSLFAFAVVMLVAAKASANFHYVKIVEVFAGAPAAPNAHYVQLQMYFAGQGAVSTHSLHVFNAAGTEVQTITLATDVANAADQATILIGTASVTTAFGVAPDFTLTSNLLQSGGAVCWETTVDCFSWGNYAGPALGDGATTPFAALTAGTAARRKITGGLSPTLLEDADDTNNCAADFVAAAPQPKNNGGVTGSLPDAGTTPVDAGADAAKPPPFDSGVSTVPTPPRDAGGSSGDAATPASGSSSGSGGGCTLASAASEGWSTTLGLLAAASILVLSRRRRAKA